jgi:hypothetical protein
MRWDLFYRWFHQFTIERSFSVVLNLQQSKLCVGCPSFFSIVLVADTVVLCATLLLCVGCPSYLLVFIFFIMCCLPHPFTARWTFFHHVGCRHNCLYGTTIGVETRGSACIVEMPQYNQERFLCKCLPSRNVCFTTLNKVNSVLVAHPLYWALNPFPHRVDWCGNHCNHRLPQ